MFLRAESKEFLQGFSGGGGIIHTGFTRYLCHSTGSRPSLKGNPF